MKSSLLSLAALIFGACSSFNRDFRAAAKAPLASGKDASPFAGAWDGKWTEEKHRQKNGEPGGGRLRCIFTKQDATHYRARFRANWKCFVSGYETLFTTHEHDGVLDFKGEHDLGALFGGIYHYEGHVTPGHFRAKYTSSYDHGDFDMQRAKP